MTWPIVKNLGFQKTGLINIMVTLKVKKNLNLNESYLYDLLEFCTLADVKKTKKNNALRNNELYSFKLS